MSRVLLCVCECVLNLLRMAIVFEKGIIFFFQKKSTLRTQYTNKTNETAELNSTWSNLSI